MAIACNVPYCVMAMLCALPGCMMAIAMGRESTEYQNKLAEADAFQQLVRLLRQRKQNESVLLMIIKVIGTLCIG